MPEASVRGGGNFRQWLLVYAGVRLIVRMSGVLSLIVVLLGLGACGGESPTSPSDPLVAVFRVSDETFRIRLDTPELRSAARAARDGAGPRIPNGVIAAGTDVNTGWSWHLRAVEFADATIELCDGRPSMVEQQGIAFGGGRFCPWGAQIIAFE